MDPKIPKVVPAILTSAVVTLMGPEIDEERRTWVGFQLDWSKLQCERGRAIAEDVLYFECIIYVTNNKLKWIEINCTMCTRPVLPVPKHIYCKKKGAKFEPKIILDCV